MNLLENVVDEIDKLKIEEKRQLLYILMDKIFMQSIFDNNQKQIFTEPANIFADFRGIATGFWNMDAQQYINLMRDDDRF